MKKPTYWKNHYVLEADADVVERNIKTTSFVSDGNNFELIYFEKSNDSPIVLISPGSGGHSYVFAELAYEMHLKGYSVFIMPKHGSATINELVKRHSAALRHISTNFNERIGLFGEGLGGFASFYLALGKGPMKSIVCQNSPAILTEKEFQIAYLKGGGAAKRRQNLLPLMKFTAKIFPSLKVPISLYLDFRELVDTNEGIHDLETHIVEGYLQDPDFDRKYTLSAIMSLVLTPPPNPLTELKIPTMFLVPTRGWTDPSYVRHLYNRLPPIKKKFVEVDGSVFWMVSHPKEAAEIICDWFKETL